MFIIKSPTFRLKAKVIYIDQAVFDLYGLSNEERL